MKRLPLIIGAVVAGVVALVLFQRCGDTDTDEDVGKYRERAERLARDSAEAASVVRRVDSVYVGDTIKLTKTLTRFRTRVDSLRVIDTLTLREQVIVAAADTAIKACRDVVLSCENRVAARDTMIRILRDQRSTDKSLFAAQLKRANPRVVPYAEALVDPLDSYAFNGRVGVELRLLGPIRLTTAAQYLTPTNDVHPHPWHALVGVRVTF